VNEPKGIQRQTTVGLVVDELRRRIIAGELPEGKQLRQETLARELGVSRIPLREALRQLEAEGLVAIASHRGAVVSKLETKDIAELFELRIHLECWLLGLAVPKMNEADFARCDDALEAMLSNKKLENWGLLNWNFHEALYRAADREVTIKLLKRINDNVDRYIRLQISLTSGQLKAHREHKRLLTLCRARNARGAVAELEQHIAGVRDQLMSQLSGVEDETAARAKARPSGNGAARRAKA
jgi:DNA-binding GntR family transcriptional regulator